MRYPVIALVSLLLLSTILPAGTAQPPVVAASPPALMTELTTRADLSPSQQQRINQLAAQAKEGTLKLVRINTTAAFGDALRLGVTGGEAVLHTETMERRSEREFSWSGADLPPQDPGVVTGTRAVLVARDGEMFGTIHRGTTILELRPVGSGLHALFEPDFRKLPPEHPDGTGGEHPRLKRKQPAATDPPSPSLDAEPKARADERPPAIAAPLVPCSPIDVLVAYTAAAAKRVGNVDLLVSLAEKETNNSYANSQILSRIHVVHAYQTTYEETGSVLVDLASFRDSVDGIMDEVHHFRDLYGADLAVLIVDNADACGLAADIYADADNAFALVRADCATGYYSFGHEIGHLRGARHNPEADPDNEPYPYCHGYFDKSLKVRTVMSYDCDGGCTRIDYWAGPNVRYSGKPLGTAGLHEDARVLDETSCRVAGFRTSQRAGLAGPPRISPATVLSPRPAGTLPAQAAPGGEK